MQKQQALFANSSIRRGHKISSCSRSVLSDNEELLWNTFPVEELWVQPFIAGILALAILQQAILPVVACSHCAKCQQFQTGSVADDADQSACCSVSGNAAGVSRAATGCCQTFSGADSATHSSCCSQDKGGCGTAIGSCCCAPVEAEMTVPVTKDSAKLALALLLVSVYFTPADVVVIPEQKLSACAGWSVDDRTRPHRFSRCHLLDCVWLI